MRATTMIRPSPTPTAATSSVAALRFYSYRNA
jgi:hypothetical protein